jgi:hypothetical protein
MRASHFFDAPAPSGGERFTKAIGKKNMKTKYLGPAALIGFLNFGAATASADTATFKLASMTGCPNCTATDSTGLIVTALGHLLPNGWDVRADNYALRVANRNGVVFTLPGKTFDLTGLKLFATNQASSTTAPVTYTLYAYHLNNPVADVVQFQTNSRVIVDMPFTDPRLTNIDTLIVRYGPEVVGYGYFIETRFTPH